MTQLRITRETLKDGTLRARQREYAQRHPDMRWRSDTEMAEIFEQTLAAHPADEDLWVFGYGSLIWNPAFHFKEQRCALLRGWHRRFCLKLMIGRGTPETPGVMLALDHGGACRGVAFRIGAEQIREELWLLWQREMYGGAYNVRWVWLEAGGNRVRAVTFVINRRHPRYIKQLSIEQTASLIASGRGDLGTCREYFENTVSHLRELGVRDAALMRIAASLPTA
ncbi:gamma-glutamylcyclotransferase [Acidocella aminolytica]|jgi:cation transport protein ChaC|uniref:glutathione-specific gamma-glutamylcyclotransferase n=1 Tax=Acidocella aminolytica 101 = DSM 11237 TaxID=1120923 RepID=A0A0D6PCH3_9PROT|nr:gamma-glutamylcyclotransferase [Acidocella aminolytica]GAN78903.1 cation transporter [Acidocella aminolytica 101 = DSM 11237]GBQ42262.1 cation transport protein ChaC [Acidocella aminolytica 101 = DSM 11237]SHE98897.1 cation transport protein ChaC [Acidocella aminolytica 101 = DSM 11237]